MRVKTGAWWIKLGTQSRAASNWDSTLNRIQRRNLSRTLSPCRLNAGLPDWSDLICKIPHCYNSRQKKKNHIHFQQNTLCRKMWTAIKNLFLKCYGYYRNKTVGLMYKAGYGKKIIKCFYYIHPSPYRSDLEFLWNPSSC